MKTQDLIKFLRTNLKIQELTNADPAFLALSNEDIELVLNIACSKEGVVFSSIIADSILYPVILNAKRELYYQLATNTAPLYPLKAEAGEIKKDVRFTHYMELIKSVQKEYKDYIEQNYVAESYSVLLEGRYFTNRNYNLSTPPTITLLADNVYATAVELSWYAPHISKFDSYVLYISDSPIIDSYGDKLVKDTATLAFSTYDFHHISHRISDLTSDTKYYIAIVVQERNGLKGFSEIDFTTLIGG